MSRHAHADRAGSRIPRYRPLPQRDEHGPPPLAVPRSQVPRRLAGKGGDRLGDEIINPDTSRHTTLMAGKELPTWAIRLREERIRRLWSQKLTAVRLRDA